MESKTSFITKGVDHRVVLAQFVNGTKYHITMQEVWANYLLYYEMYTMDVYMREFGEWILSNA